MEKNEAVGLRAKSKVDVGFLSQRSFAQFLLTFLIVARIGTEKRACARLLTLEPVARSRSDRLGDVILDAGTRLEDPHYSSNTNAHLVGNLLDREARSS